MRALALAIAVCVLPGALAAQDVVAARTLRAGTVLTPDDMRAAPDATGAETAMARFAGKEVRRAIYAGRPITTGSLGPPTLVRRNGIVRMVFRRNGLGIRTEGRALEAGGEGERIRVLNLASRQQVTAVVRAAGLVEVRR